MSQYIDSKHIDHEILANLSVSLAQTIVSSVPVTNEVVPSKATSLPR